MLKIIAKGAEVRYGERLLFVQMTVEDLAKIVGRTNDHLETLDRCHFQPGTDWDIASIWNLLQVISNGRDRVVGAAAVLENLAKSLRNAAELVKLREVNDGERDSG